MFAAAMAAVTVGRLAAVTVGPDWCVAYPDTGSKDINRVLRIAAEEVRDDINEATGLKLKAVPASKAKAPAIWIGAAFAKKAGFDLSGLKWYDNVVAEKNGSIYCFGNDRTGRDPEKVGRVAWWQCVLPSVKAATRFLETAAGVRFLMPGEVGKEVPKRREISVADGSFAKESPMLVYGSGRSNNNRELIYRVANGVWGMGPFHSYGGHTYYVACPTDKYFKSHPEYFGLRNGKRMLGKTPGQTPLCISNPAVEELIVDELKRHFDMGVEVCQLGQHDGGWVCECEKCRAMYGTGDDWSEKLWLFHRHIAERILKERPGKIVHIMSYTATAKPPKTFKVFPENVMIEMCRCGEDDFEAWKDYVVPHGFTVYVYLGGNYVTPGLTARHSIAYLAQIVKRFRVHGIKGVYRCGVYGSSGDLYGTEGPGYYVFNRLLLDGSLNVNELLQEYCTAAFGPAAASMRRFYDVQDTRMRMFDKIVEPFPVDSAAGLDGYVSARPRNSLDLHGWMFSPDTTALMEECLSRAEKTEGLSSKHKKRLELVRLEFDYAKNLGAISTLHAAYKLRPSKESRAPVLDAVKERNAMLDRIFCGKDKPKKLDGWPELNPFGSTCTRAFMNFNGRSSARIGAPLTWPTKMLDSVLPGATVKKTDAWRADAPPAFGEFNVGSGWNALGGLSMEKIPFNARFKAMYDDSNLYLLAESDLADGVTLKSFPQDGPVWDDDCIDFMIAPGSSRDVYYHLICGFDGASRYDDVTGLITDTLDPSYGKADVTWNGKGWKVESRREDGKWRAIVTLPYSDFGVAAPNPGDSWFLNVGHVFKTGANRKEQILALWSPNVESTTFVAPNAMGKLIFK
jgi:hypothetical protein